MGARLHARRGDAAAEKRWTAHVTKMYAMMLMRKAKSWFTGYNSNVPGHEQGTIRYLVYNGGTPKYVAAINDVVRRAMRGSSSRQDSGLLRSLLCKHAGWVERSETHHLM